MKLREFLTLRIEPELPGAQDIEAMHNRAVRLQALYHAFHRDKQGQRGTYTGLHAQAMQELPDGL